MGLMLPEVASGAAGAPSGVLLRSRMGIRMGVVGALPGSALQATQLLPLPVTDR